ncbi:hypothetical protein Tco_1505571 [Tanacetum coccineum]
MANMDFCDKHNMVAFLQKPTGSEEFHQIVNFLAGSHIRYALITNLTIYVSLIEQFWQTATVETINDGEQQITVTVDGQTIAITEASVRRHIQLADADGGDTPGSDEGSKKLNELTELCTKLSDKVTSLEDDLKQTKKVYGKALTKLVKKVKHLEAKLKSTSGRMTETEYEDVDVETEYEEVEYKLDQTNTLQQITPIKVLQDASRERVKTYKSYTRRRRSTVSSRDSTARGLFSTVEEILSTDERITQKLNEEEMAKATAREEQERIDFEKALELQK